MDKKPPKCATITIRCTPELLNTLDDLVVLLSLDIGIPLSRADAIAVACKRVADKLSKERNKN